MKKQDLTVSLALILAASSVSVSVLEKVDFDIAH
jgi:hypothetical protein